MRLEEKARNASELVKLNDNPSFQYLKLVAERHRDKLVEVLTRAILSEQPLDQRKVDYLRGLSDGAIGLVTRPENAESTLKNALKRLEEGTTNG